MLIDPTLQGTLQRAEGLILHAYPDGGGVLTIGYGHTGKDVFPGMVCTPAAALKWLQDDISEALQYTVHLDEYTAVADNQARRNALTEAVFNLGIETWTNEFPKSRRSIKASAWPMAAKNVLASPEWIHDVGLSRVSRIALQLRDGAYPISAASSSSLLQASSSQAAPSGAA